MRKTTKSTKLGSPNFNYLVFLAVFLVSAKSYSFDPKSYEYVGKIEAEGIQGIAVLKRKNSQKSIHVQLNQAIPGSPRAKLIRLERRAAIFSNGRKEFRVTMKGRSTSKYSSYARNSSRKIDSRYDLEENQRRQKPKNPRSDEWLEDRPPPSYRDSINELERIRDRRGYDKRPQRPSDHVRWPEDDGLLDFPPYLDDDELIQF